MAKGYDNIPILMQTRLDLPFYEGTGALAHDISRPSALNKTTTIVTAAWEQVALSNITVLNLNAATPDYLTLAAASCTDLNFTTGALNSFSGCVWIYPHVLVGADRTIFARGLLNTDGWEFLIQDTGEVTFRTNQTGPPAANQITYSAAASVVINAWQFVAFTRSGGVAEVYCNMDKVTSTSGVHVTPLTSARDLHIGTSDAHANSFDGLIAHPRIWDKVMSTSDFLELFHLEHELFGVAAR